MIQSRFYKTIMLLQYSSNTESILSYYDSCIRIQLLQTSSVGQDTRHNRTYSKKRLILKPSSDG